LKVLSICQQLHLTLPVIPDLLLGEGADGQTFSIKDDPLKVIKLSLLFGSEDKYQSLAQALQYLIDAQPLAYVPVHQFGYLGKTSSLNKEQHLCYYMMDKLITLSSDEYKAFHSLISHEDANKTKNYSDSQINSMLSGLSQGLEFDTTQVKYFLTSLQDSKIKHQDLHPRNIMKNKANQFKLVDLDRLTINT
jgi:hypothetical protein